MPLWSLPKDEWIAIFAIQNVLETNETFEEICKMNFPNDISQLYQQMFQTKYAGDHVTAESLTIEIENLEQKANRRSLSQSSKPRPHADLNSPTTGKRPVRIEASFKSKLTAR